MTDDPPLHHPADVLVPVPYPSPRRTRAQAAPAAILCRQSQHDIHPPASVRSSFLFFVRRPTPDDRPPTPINEDTTRENQNERNTPSSDPPYSDPDSYSSS